MNKDTSQSESTTTLFPLFFMRIRSFFSIVAATTILPLVLASCSGAGDPDRWQETSKEQVIISPYIDSSTGERFLNVIYENFSRDSIRKLKYQLITWEQGKVDTTEREIVLERRLLPQDRRLVARRQTEKPVAYERVESGKVWIIK